MLGSSLREAREAKQLPLREVEWATRIRSQYLAALEDEDFNRLPAPAYARGYIRAYAEYLGIDPGPLLVEYGSRQGAAEIISTRPPVRRRRAPIAITPGLIAGGVMLLLVALFIFYIGSAIQRFEASKNAAASSARPTPISANLFAPTPTPSPPPPPAPSPSPAFNGAHLDVTVDTDVWLRVEVDGSTSAATGTSGKVFPAGTRLVFDGQRSVHIRSGKASHTFVAFNGGDRAAMPSSIGGDIGDKTYTKP